MTATTVEMERLLPGPIERVWEHLTQPELLASWLGDTNREIRRFELEQRGQNVLLKLTHRFIGLATVLAVGLAVFLLGQPSNPVPERQQIGVMEAAPRLKFHSSAPEALYGMLGGRC